MNNYMEPEISWNKAICPACKMPTGTKSNCHLLQVKDISIVNGSVLNIFNESCLFRQNNIWDCDINYPFSEELLDRISNVPGINKVIAVAKYKFTVHISPIFDEMNVKKNITIIYNTFIKELLCKLPKKDSLNRNITIVMPNNEKHNIVCLTTEELISAESVAMEITSGILDSKAISQKNDRVSDIM